MLAFLAAVLLLIITPGPGVLSTAGVGAAYGFRPGLSYVAGLFVGNHTVALAVVTGLAAIVLSVPWLRYSLFLLSILYLLYLAAKIALAGSRIGFIHPERPPGFLGGFALQLINPKAYVVNTALMSGFAFMPGNLSLEIAIKILLITLVWIPVHLAWLWAGVLLNRLDLPPRTHRIINIFMALAMLAVVAIALVFGSGVAS